MTDKELLSEKEIRKVTREIRKDLDQDGDKILDREEMKKYFIELVSDIGKFNEEKFDKFFKEVDKDGSGKIETNELYLAVKKFLEELLS